MWDEGFWNREDGLGVQQALLKLAFGGHSHNSPLASFTT